MPQDSLCLLALDGGGVRGLSSLMILAQLMETINPDTPPKPCDYFDMIAGTSTGGLIAIMLGRLKMSIDECIDAYLSLSKRVFEKKAHRINIKGKLQGRFDSSELEQSIKDTIVQCGLAENALLKDEPNANCKVFVCATSKETSEIINLTSFKSPHVRVDLLNNVRIWEACRATSAASTFFDSIAVGRYQEEFVDGATGANNPVQELWNQAQSLWGPESIEDRVQCLVSIGTGIPSLKPFQDDVLGIGKTLAAIATETEQTAQRFQRDKSGLDASSRYFRFNVIRGLEEIGLEESQKQKEIAAATGRYVNSSDVVKQMQACAKSAAGRQSISNIYDIPFNLEGVPITKEFIDRPTELKRLGETLLPNTSKIQRKIHVLRGLGGIGKTQLAVAFMQRHREEFSAIFWLDGSSEDTLKQSIIKQAQIIPAIQINSYGATREINTDLVVREVLNWLAKTDNNRWLLIYDNVDRDINNSNDPLAYNVKRYFPTADHGSILITTRLTALESMGQSQEIKKVNRDSAQAILSSWYKGINGYDAHIQRLLELLDGLPLAISQAGAYLQQSGMSIKKYLHIYEEQREEVVEILDNSGVQLDDYLDRSIWTTWTISYNAVLQRNEHAAHLLLLWSYYNRNDFWHGILSKPMLSESLVRAVAHWIGDIAWKESSFREAMRLLRSYSLIEGAGHTEGYTMHTVVHHWSCLYSRLQNHNELELGLLALSMIANSIPVGDARFSTEQDQRIFPHAQACFERVFPKQQDGAQTNNNFVWKPKAGSFLDATDVLDALRCYSILYRRHGKTKEAQMMAMIAMQGSEKELGAKGELTLSCSFELGIIYSQRGELQEAEKMLLRTIQGFKELFGVDNHVIFAATHNLAAVYTEQWRRYADKDKLLNAETTFTLLVNKREGMFGIKDLSTLAAVENLGFIYVEQGKFDTAREMYMQAMHSYEEVLGPGHLRTLYVAGYLGNLYVREGKHNEAEKMLLRVLRGFEAALGPDDMQTSPTVYSTITDLGDLYFYDRPDEAKIMYERALAGLRTVCADSSWRIIYLEQRINELELSTRSREIGAEPDTDAPDENEQEVNDQRVMSRNKANESLGEPRSRSKRWTRSSAKRLKR